MTQTKRGLLLILAWLVGSSCFSWVLAQEPAVVAPVSNNPDDSPYLYVLGPRASAKVGREDSRQVVFFQVPAGQAGQVTLYVYDPGTGGKGEDASGWFFSSSTTTQIDVYGGQGALTGSATVRPTADQAGTKLASETFGKEKHGEWVAFGPYSSSDAEVVGGSAYFKLVVTALDGSATNNFRVGCSAPGTEIFGYDLTVKLVKELGLAMDFVVAVPTGVSQLIESNYDLDNGGTPTLNGATTKISDSGEWVSTTVPANGVARASYIITKGVQSYANAGFHVTDQDGNPLRIYLKPANFEQPAPAVGPNCALTQTTLVSLTKCMPPKTSVGETFDATLTVTANECIQHVHVVDMVPPELEYVSSDPAAQVQGSQLSWVFPEMQKGESKTITVKLRGKTEGTFLNCASIFAEPMLCTDTVVGKPVLEIVKTGPEVALLDSAVKYDVTVTNKGNITARNVVVTDTLPAGLTNPKGQKLQYNLGDIEPGASKKLTVDATAAQRGKHCNVAEATSDNAGKVNAQACTTVVKPALEVVKKGPAKQYTGKTASYSIVVRNPGDVDLHDVVVTDTAPANTTIVSANKATVTGNTAVWKFAELKAGQEISGLTVVLTSEIAGTHCNKVAVDTKEGQKAAAEACTEWVGFPALLIEMVDTKDPLLPGEHTSYIIEVTNQGTAVDTNVRITVAFPGEISPVSAAGDTACQIKGKSVTVAPYAVLKPKQKIRWTIDAKAEASTGDARIKVQLFSDLLKTPVNEEESTHVY